MTLIVNGLLSPFSASGGGFYFIAATTFGHGLEIVLQFV